MRRRRTVAVAAIAAALLAVGAIAGIARAVSGSDEQVTGPPAKRAAAAAVEAAGGGKAVEVEYADDDGAGVYEVEVRRKDGSQVEVHLDGGFRRVGTAPDDDGSESSGTDD